MSTEPVSGPLERLRHASSIFLNRAMLAIRAGITFQGSRDLYQALGYQRVLRPIDYRSRYSRGGIAKRVTDAIPSATWRGGCEVLETEDPDVETEFESAFEAFAKRLNLWNAIKKTDILSQQGQFAVMLIGAPGDLRDPLPEYLAEDEIVYIQPYSQEDVLVQLIDADAESSRFGLPTLYQVRRLAGSAYFGYSVGSKLVHHSRIVHVADGRLDDRIFGHPILETVWNYLDDLEKISGGGAEAFWKRADQGIIFNMDPATEMSPAEATAVQAAADDFIHGYRRTMATRGMEAKQMGSDTADISKSADAIITLIAGATGIPKRILVGSERGELASTQDRENWEQRISDRRRDYAEPEILRPMIDMFIELGVLPQPEEVIIRWPDIEYLNETEQATIANQWAQINKNAGAVVVLPQEIRDRVLRLEKLEEHQLPDPMSPFAPPELRKPLFAQNLLDNPSLASNDSYVDRLQDNPDTQQPDVSPPPQSLFAPLQIASRSATRYRPIAPKLVKTAIKKRLVGTAKYHTRKALKAARGAHNHAAVRTAHTRGKSDLMLAMAAPIATLKASLHKLRPAIAEAHHRSRKLTRLHVKGKLRNASAIAVIRNAVQIDDASLQYAAEKAASAISDIDDQTRENISNMIDKAFEQGWTPDKLASRLEDIIPLSSPQVDALEGLRSKLEDGQPGDVVEFGDRSARIPSDGGSDEWIDKQVDVYSDDLLSDRAEMIAETSVGQAAADGQRDEWRDLLDSGEIDEDTMRRWVAGAEACEAICADMDGEVTGINEPYSDDSDGPLAHPFCDCDEELFTPEKSAKSSDQEEEA